MKVDGPIFGPIGLSVGSTALEAKVGASKEESRLGVLIQPLNGDVYFGYDSGVTTSSGFVVRQNNIYFVAASGRFLDVYLVASSTVDVRIAEIA
jgi:hypothetical protein